MTDFEKWKVLTMRARAGLMLLGAVRVSGTDLDSLGCAAYSSLDILKHRLEALLSEPVAYDPRGKYVIFWVNSALSTPEQRAARLPVVTFQEP